MSQNFIIKLNTAIFCVLFSAFCGISYASEKSDILGSENNPIKLFFTPSSDAKGITTNSDQFTRYLEKETGLFFKTSVPANYIAVVEAFGSNRADIAVMNSFGYLLAHSKYGAQAYLKTLRHGKEYYSGQIIYNSKSGIRTLKDLQGKKFAFTDSASTSGYLFPLKILNDNKIKLGASTFAMKHDNVVTMVYQGQVDAGATFYSEPIDGKIQDARERVKTQFPDVEDRVKILTVTSHIPNDPFVFRKDLPTPLKDKFIAALSKYLQTAEGKETFKKMYSMDGVVPAKDADYNDLRKVIKESKSDLESLIK